jgi:hypothetical protein
MNSMLTGLLNYLSASLLIIELSSNPIMSRFPKKRMAGLTGNG